MIKTNNKTLMATWNKEAESYSVKADTSPDYLAYFEEVETAMGNLRNKKICDVGSGTGITSAYLARQGAKLNLVDISAKAIAFQKKYFKLHNLSARFFQQDAFDMKFPPESFDCVWNGGVIEHFNDEEKILMMKKMWKLVKPGGVLLITAPNARDYPFMTAKEILIRRKKWAFGFEDDLTDSRLKNLAVKAGISNFSIYAFNPIVGWWFFPYGRETTNLLGLNKPAMHRMRTPFGHHLFFCAKK